MRRLALLAVLLVVAGCGGSSSGDAPSGGDAPRSNRLVDRSQKPPYVNALEVDPQTKDLLLTTNRGFFRIDPKTKQVTQVRGKVVAGARQSRVGTFLELGVDEDGTLLGSGHPDDTNLPQFLGFLRSEDDGRTWQVVSRLGDADLHKVVRRHGRLYAFDAVLSAMLISKDDGRTFDERFTPRGLIIDFEVDPADPDRIVAANEQELFRSEDGGQRWRALSGGEGVRLAWPAPDALYRADQDGTFKVSEDGGTSFDDVGEVPGEPSVIEALSATELLVALSDASIVRTTDGGRSWDEVFRP